jgi:D-glycero-alpha-D-manno-heptose 1-phosphate guanylyltransferase
MSVRQCVILVGGLGSRLGDLTRETPKPMLPVAGRPFLDHLLAKASRHGFTRVLLLAGHGASVIEQHLARSELSGWTGLDIAVAVEPTLLGTGGALTHARSRLDDAFLLVNGDTWFDFDWRVLADWDAYPVSMALRAVAPADRYETVVLDAGKVVRMLPRDPRLGPGLINGGVIRLTRDVVPMAAGVSSLERDLLPALCAADQVGGRIFDGDFIDIGVPESLAAASNLVTPRLN